MKKAEILNVLTDLQQNRNAYLNAIEDNVIEECCYIIEVGALTVATDDDGKVISQNARYPMQFSKPAIDIILSIDWYNGNAEKIEPVVFGRNNWYKKRIENIDETLEVLKSHPSFNVKTN